jgi:hypothetical protein
MLTDIYFHHKLTKPNHQQQPKQTTKQTKAASKNETEAAVEYTTEIRDKPVRVPLEIVRTDRGMPLRRISQDDIIAARKLLKDWYATDEQVRT